MRDQKRRDVYRTVPVVGSGIRYQEGLRYCAERWGHIDEVEEEAVGNMLGIDEGLEDKEGSTKILLEAANQDRLASVLVMMVLDLDKNVAAVRARRNISSADHGTELVEDHAGDYVTILIEILDGRKGHKESHVAGNNSLAARRLAVRRVPPPQIPVEELVYQDRILHC